MFEGGSVRLIKEEKMKFNDMGNPLPLEHSSSPSSSPLDVYRLLAESVPDGVALMQDGRFVMVNDAFGRIFGYAGKQEVIGKFAGANIRDDHKEGFKETIAAIEAGRLDRRVLRWPCTTRDGREIYVEGHPNRVEWAGRPAVLSTVIDITDAYRRETAIRNETLRLKRENVKLKSTMKDRYRLGGIIGASRIMQEVYGLIIKAAATDAGVIIYGESGTGKELAARAIHDLSDRSTKEFVVVNCGAIPENLMEREFFGHRKGAFTGAHADTPGFLDHAHGSTLFLDEVGEISPGMQVKLLRAVEGGGYVPVGDTVPRHGNFRIIAATNRNLQDLVRAGRMREDFFYRIHVLPIRIPPLRERLEDIPFLIDHFLRERDFGKSLSQMPGRVLEAMYRHSWPGNVRELYNSLHRYLTVGSMDFLSDLSGVEKHTEKSDSAGLMESGESLRSYLDRVEKRVILETLDHLKWNRSKAAADLGLPRKTFFRKMKKYGIS